MSKEKFQEFCKSVSRNGTSLSEHSLTALASVAAMQRHPGLDASRAFAKVFGDPTASDEARDFWRAIAVAKGMVEVAGDDDATDSDAEVVTGQLRRVRERQRRAGTAHDFGESDDSALEKLQAIAKRQQRDGETIEQSFTRAFTAPENVALARAERRQNGFIR